MNKKYGCGSGLIVSETSLNKASKYQIKVEDLSLHSRGNKYEIKDDFQLEKKKPFGNVGEKSNLTLLNFENRIKDSSRSKASNEKKFDKVDEQKSE